jgi:hypothetical protein
MKGAISLGMIGVELVSEFVDSVVHTGFIKDDKPLSVMLIAAPESGKTSVTQDRDCTSVLTVSDMIGSGLLEELQAKPGIRHVIINDMVSIMAHKDVTNARTFAILNMLSEEGLGKIVMPGGLAKNLGGRQVGFICCIPSQLAGDNRRWWNSTGFASRLLPFNYVYSERLLLQIKRTIIMTGLYKNKRVEKKEGVNPIVEFSVSIKKSESADIQAIADSISKRLTEQGLRRGKQLRSLAAGRALSFNRRQVNSSDIDFLWKIEEHIDFENPKILEFGKADSEKKKKSKHKGATNAKQPNGSQATDIHIQNNDAVVEVPSPGSDRINQSQS